LIGLELLIIMLKALCKTHPHKIVYKKMNKKQYITVVTHTHIRIHTQSDITWLAPAFYYYHQIVVTALHTMPILKPH